MEKVMLSDQLRQQAESHRARMKATRNGMGWESFSREMATPQGEMAASRAEIAWQFMLEESDGRWVWPFAFMAAGFALFGFMEPLLFLGAGAFSLLSLIIHRGAREHHYIGRKWAEDFKRRYGFAFNDEDPSHD